MNSRKILVTGGCGFVGTNLSLRLMSLGDEVVIYDNFSRKGSLKNRDFIVTKYPDIRIINEDVKDIDKLFEKETFDLIYHLAGQVAVTTSYENPKDDFHTNAYGSFLVADSGIPAIYMSTNKVYGDNVNDVPLKELDTRYDFDGDLAESGVHENFSIDSKKHTPYGTSKLVGELYIRENGGIANRCSCLYGPHQHGNVDQGWFSHFIFEKLRGNEITIFGDGKQVRDALYVDDLIDLLVLQGENIAELSGEFFNIGGGYENTISLLEFCEMLELPKVFGEWRPSDQKVYYSNINKAKERLGWSPKIGIKEGVERTKKWAESFYSEPSI